MRNEGYSDVLELEKLYSGLRRSAGRFDVSSLSCRERSRLRLARKVVAHQIPELKSLCIGRNEPTYPFLRSKISTGLDYLARMESIFVESGQSRSKKK